MGSMTTFEARVGYTAASQHLSIVTFAYQDHIDLPLAICTVTLKEGELFQVEGQGATGHFADLLDALRFARDNGAAMKPGAITILTPCLSYNGIPAWNSSQIHDRAIAIAAA